MHEYLVEVLTKVSFDRALFLNELRKSRRWLTTEEWESLYQWAETNYSHLLFKETTHLFEMQNDVLVY
jgi:hypothetical protein